MFMDLKNIVKMFALLKAIYGFNTILMKVPMAFFSEIGKKILNFVQNHKKTPKWPE